MSTINRSVLLLVNGDVEWPSAFVAIAIIAFLSVLMTVALTRFKMGEVLQLWGCLGTVAGLLSGAFVAYFFTHEVQRQEIPRSKTQTCW